MMNSLRPSAPSHLGASISVVRGRFTVWRDSVSMGDDVSAPHSQHFSSNGVETLKDFVKKIGTPLLASISTGNATWVLKSSCKNHTLAVYAQQWEEPRLVLAEATKIENLIDPNNEKKYDFKFHYYQQQDPEEVFLSLHKET